MLGKTLETLVPPPLVTAAMIGLLWWADRVGVGRIAMAPPFWLAFLLIGLALLLMLLAVLQLFRARTTVNPLHPERSQSLVTQGVFKFSRNPIYLGDALMIVAAGVLIHNWVALVVLCFFVFYITRYQIQPEESALREKFRQEFGEYCANTRRWL